MPVFDVFSYLGFLAGQTEQIHFGTQVYNIGLRHPFVVARAVTTLDVISGGRLEFGIGASWLRAEWEAVGLDFDTRGRRVDEAIAVCQRLWSEEVVEHHGEFFDFGPVMFEPKPAQAPWPPLHIGGDGPGRPAPGGHRRRRVDPDEPHGRGDRRRGQNGSPSSGRPPAAPARSRSRWRAATGSTTCAVWADLGIGRALVKPWESTKGALDGLRRFADEVLPDIRDHPVRSTDALSLSGRLPGLGRTRMPQPVIRRAGGPGRRGADGSRSPRSAS